MNGGGMLQPSTRQSPAAIVGEKKSTLWELSCLCSHPEVCMAESEVARLRASLKRSPSSGTPLELSNLKRVSGCSLVPTGCLNIRQVR